MNSTPLTNITQDQYSAALAVVINFLRTQNPSLDLREGTALRALLANPEAAISAQRSADIQALRDVMSLATMAANGTAAPGDVNAVLSNFNMTLNVGAKASGTVMVTVSGLQVYNIAAGTEFQTLEGLTFSTTVDIVVRQTPGSGETPLLNGPNGQYYFLVGVLADAAGAAFNIQSGTALTPSSSLYGVVAAQAYAAFTGGLDGETIAASVTRIPAALSQRGLVNKTSAEAQIRDVFANTPLAIQAISAQGYGDAAQIRDRHNVFGVSVGGRVDLYCRTFLDPVVVTLKKTGTLVAPGSYRVSIMASDAPGFYMVKSITDFGSLALSSYGYQDVRSVSGLTTTFHDIDPNNAAKEAAYTAWQTSTITVTGVPDSAATRDFSVMLYCAPGIQTIQQYCDQQDVRSMTADFLVRSPLMCLVGCQATVYYPVAAPIAISALQGAVVRYINGRSFVPRLTRSELVSVLLQNGATRVDLGLTGMTLTGSIRGADGTLYELRGDSLDISGLRAPHNLVDPSTCCFVAEAPNIVLTGVPE